MHPARAFALGAHGVKKYGDKPYVYHLDRAVEELTAILALPIFRFNEKSCIISATYMHDVLEDCSHVSRELIASIFNQEVADLVDAVSDGPGANRAERKEWMYDKVRAVGPPAIAVKMADRMANVKHCVNSNDKGLLGMYRKEHEGFKSHLYIEEMKPIWVKMERIIGLGE